MGRAQCRSKKPGIVHGRSAHRVPDDERKYLRGPCENTVCRRSGATVGARRFALTPFLFPVLFERPRGPCGACRERGEGAMANTKAALPPTAESARTCRLRRSAKHFENRHSKRSRGAGSAATECSWRGSLGRRAGATPMSRFRLMQRDSSTPSSHCSSVVQNDSCVPVCLRVYLYPLRGITMHRRALGRLGRPVVRRASRRSLPVSPTRMCTMTVGLWYWREDLCGRLQQPVLLLLLVLRGLRRAAVAVSGGGCGRIGL